jgi:hypothetical protein
MLQLLLAAAPSLAAKEISAAEYEQEWNVAMLSLVRFALLASPPDAATLSIDRLQELDAERADFDLAITKLLLSDPPMALMRRHLSLMPMCQELATAMVLVTDGVRAGDYAATEAARRWVSDRLADLFTAMRKLEVGR